MRDKEKCRDQINSADARRPQRCGNVVKHVFSSRLPRLKVLTPEWVVKVLTRIKSVKTGMTRKALLTLFTTEGGLSTGLQRTYVSRECPYFKVDVEFKAVGRPSRDEEGRVTLVEGDDDVIVRLSVPYLDLSHMD